MIYHMFFLDNLLGIPLYVRGYTVGGAPGISKAQFSKFLKQVPFVFGHVFLP